MSGGKGVPYSSDDCMTCRGKLLQGALTAHLTVRCAFLTIVVLFLQCAFPYNCGINVEWPGNSPMMLSHISRLCKTA